MNDQQQKTGIIYARVSSAEQIDNTSLESQEKYCRDYSFKEHIEILKTFVEKGESAKTANRTEFNKAIAFCSTKKSKVDFFIVYKVDRFARNQDDHAIVRANLKRFGTELRSATEPINETPNGRLMEGIIASFAEFDNSIRTERSKNGMYEKLKKGIWQWQAPFGYCRPYKGANIVPDATTAPFIVMIFEEYAKGIHTYKSLADYINNRGFITKQGKPLCMQMVEKILKNQLYIARIKIWDLDIKGDFEALVSEDLFDQCQKGYKSKYTKMSRSAKNPNFPLRKILICTECISSLTGSVTTKIKNGTKVGYPYYHHHKQGCKKSGSLPKEKLEQLFVEYLNNISPTGKYERTFKAIMMDIWRNNYKKLNQNNLKIRRELDDLERERLKIFDFHRAGKYSDKEFLEQKEIINNRARQKQRLLEDNHVEEFSMEEALNYCFSFVKETSKNWIRFREKNYNHLMQFQNHIFPGKITFNGEKFGTTNLSLIYKMNEQFGADESNLVTLQRIEL